MIHQIQIAFIFSLLTFWAACAQEASKGKALATTLCATCHMNEGQGEKQGEMSIPSFQAIANRPGQTHEAIVRWLRSAPPAMPDHKLTWDEADELADFILSLRQKPWSTNPPKRGQHERTSFIY